MFSCSLCNICLRYTYNIWPIRPKYLFPLFMKSGKMKTRLMPHGIYRNNTIFIVWKQHSTPYWSWALLPCFSQPVARIPCSDPISYLPLQMTGDGLMQESMATRWCRPPPSTALQPRGSCLIMPISHRPPVPRPGMLFLPDSTTGDWDPGPTCGAPWILPPLYIHFCLKMQGTRLAITKKAGDPVIFPTGNATQPVRITLKPVLPHLWKRKKPTSLSVSG